MIVRLTPDGKVLDTVRIDDDPVAFAHEVANAGAGPEVALGASYGWYWSVDALTACGATAHLAHPLGVKSFSYRRVKNDVRYRPGGSASDGPVAEVWIAPPRTRELRELARYGAKLTALRSG